MSSIPSVARDLAREVGPKGFDGNLSDGTLHWWFILEPVHDPDDVAASVDALMEKTSDGCFSWVVFPLEGFRL